MVTSTCRRYSTERDLNNNNNITIDQPLICVDGYLIACRYDGDSCTPVFGISVDELLNIVQLELDSTKVCVI